MIYKPNEYIKIVKEVLNRDNFGLESEINKFPEPVKYVTIFEGYTPESWCGTRLSRLKKLYKLAGYQLKEINQERV